MNPDRLFIYRVEALRRIVKTRNAEELLELAGILRQLLLDSSPLIDHVNRKHRKKIRFVVGQSSEESHQEMLKRVPTLPMPTIAFTSVLPNGQKRTLTRDRFLGHSLLYLRNRHFEEGYYYSVRDVITACANKLGGVHYDVPEKDTEQESLIRGFNEFASLYGSPFAFATLAEIAIVVDSAIEPLFEVVAQGQK